jgi:hypothetical protein
MADVSAAALATRFGPQAFTNPTPPTFYECGCCGHMHPANWDGDCRDDANRFTNDQLDTMYGYGVWAEVLTPGVSFDEYLDMVEDCQGIRIPDDQRELYRPEYESNVVPDNASPEWHVNPDQMALSL